MAMSLCENNVKELYMVERISDEDTKFNTKERLEPHTASSNRLTQHWGKNAQVVTGVNETSRKQAKSMARSEGVCAYVIGQVLTRVAEVKKTKKHE